MKLELLTGLLAAQHDKRAVVLVTRLVDGVQALLFPLEGEVEGWPAEPAAQAIAEDRSIVFEDPADGDLLFRPYNPPVRLIVVGAVHIAQPLSEFATRVGYAVTVVDPREAYASEERFPGVVLDRRWPGPALEALRPDHRTALVTLTHDPKLDDPALQAVLRTPAFYVGALGSRKTQAKRLERLTEAGFDQAALARIHGPAGLDIGARTASEIALSILSQVIAASRDRTA